MNEWVKTVSGGEIPLSRVEVVRVCSHGVYAVHRVMSRRVREWLYECDGIERAEEWVEKWLKDKVLVAYEDGSGGDDIPDLNLSGDSIL